MFNAYKVVCDGRTIAIFPTEADADSHIWTLKERTDYLGTVYTYEGVYIPGLVWWTSIETLQGFGALLWIVGGALTGVLLLR